jgi:hypothetical protein
MRKRPFQLTRSPSTRHLQLAAQVRCGSNSAIHCCWTARPLYPDERTFATTRHSIFAFAVGQVIRYRALGASRFEIDYAGQRETLNSTIENGRENVCEQSKPCDPSRES